MKQPGKHIGRSIYGVVITTTLLLTLENHEDNSWDMMAAIIFTLLAVAVSEYYALLLSRGIETRRKLGRDDLTAILKESSYMLYGSVAPTLVFILSGLGVITLLTAFNLAELIVALLLIGYGYAYGQIRGQSKLRSVLYGLANFMVVAALVLAKLLLHF